VYEQKVDVAAERERLTKDLKKLEGELANGQRQSGTSNSWPKRRHTWWKGLRKRKAEVELLLEKIRSGLDKLGSLGKTWIGTIEGSAPSWNTVAGGPGTQRRNFAACIDPQQRATATILAQTGLRFFLAGVGAISRILENLRAARPRSHRPRGGHQPRRDF